MTDYIGMTMPPPARYPLARCQTASRVLAAASPGTSGAPRAFGGITYLISCWESGRAPATIAETAKKRRRRFAMQRQDTFSEFTYMSKEDHERERARWLLKMDEIETKLVEAETLNGDMNQIKAELNKKIVDLEKQQRPLIEQNRKLAEKNRCLTTEMKRVEAKMSHHLDDFITLRDAHERLSKENALLRRERTLPEKLDELDRYRAQVLEYSKCITALRQAGLEKDRRYEVIVQRLRRVRRVSIGGGVGELLLKRSPGGPVNDLLRRSGAENNCAEEDRGSTCSSGESASLDTIAEDLEESSSVSSASSVCSSSPPRCLRTWLQRENTQLQHTLAELRRQAAIPAPAPTARSLAAASAAARAAAAERAEQTRSRLAAASERLRQQDDELERLQRELAACQEQRELLEFQLLEQQQQQHTSGVGGDAVKRVNGNSADDDTDSDENDDIIYPIPRLSFQEICQLKEDLKSLRASSGLSRIQKDVARRSHAYIESLENQWIEHEATCNALASNGSDARSKNAAQLIDEVRDLSAKLGHARFQLESKEHQLAEQQRRADELQARLDGDDGGFSDREASLRRLQSTLEESQQRLVQVEEERDKLRGDLAEMKSECDRLRAEARPSIRTELERRFEEARYRLGEALAKLEQYEMVIAAARDAEGGRAGYAAQLEKELAESRQYGEHIEQQFRAQNDIIDALKMRVISNKLAADFIATLPSVGPQGMSRAIQDFLHEQKDDASRKTVAVIADIVEMYTRDDGICDSLIDMKKAHLRECRSADSAGTDCASNTSEEVASSGRHSDEEEWHRSGDYQTYNGGSDSVMTTST